jgi:Dyp-type peroxidase family
MKNGTFMVFRRLKQLVPEFDGFVDATAASQQMDPALLGARLVGRWKSGAPVSLSPLQDNPLQGGDKLQNNDFEFDDDSAARRCPFAAHIRKSYPRNDVTPAGAGGATEFDRREASEADTQTHRIMRRGIPFGDDVTEAEARQEKTLRDRGLMFVCYQTSIGDQFEFIIENWVNNRNFAAANTGHDPILGQAGGASRMRDFVGASVNYPTGLPGPPIKLPADFIVPTGGGYFFVPSIAALKTVLTV